MERYKPATERGEDMEKNLSGLLKDLSYINEEEVALEFIDDTYEIEAESFTLTFTITEETFEIRSIDVRDNTGIGREIISAIHDYADEHELNVIASNVLDTARGFWEKMGYQEGEDEDEFFRVI